MYLKKQREKVGLSQLELAFKTKVSRYRIFMAEKGYVRLTLLEEERIRVAIRACKRGGSHA